MHTVHYPDADSNYKDGHNNGFIAAAMGLFFSVNDYTRVLEAWEQKIVDDFFESLKWNGNEGKTYDVDSVSYGDLMMMVDMNNRWTYRGSVTTPPCAQNVYWNVLRTVYPIKEEHLMQFKKSLATSADLCVDPKSGVPCVPGNNREILPLEAAHNPFIITDNANLLLPYRGLNLASKDG